MGYVCGKASSIEVSISCGFKALCLGRVSLTLLGEGWLPVISFISLKTFSLGLTMSLNLTIYLHFDYLKILLFKEFAF